MRQPRILRVTKHGASAGWLEVQTAFQRAEFIALDTEFTGLPVSDKRIRAEDMEERYAGIRESVMSRAILQLGVSIFMRSDPGEDVGADSTCLTVRTFEFLLCREGDFTISAAAGEFLADHGFDFNSMFQTGIPYTPVSLRTDSDAKSSGRTSSISSAKRRPAVTKKTTNEHPKKKRKHRESERSNPDGGGISWRPLPAGFLLRLGLLGVPVVVHNGLYDLLFLYDAFEDSLPESLQDFVRAITSLVPSVYDTKVLGESVLRQKMSNLAYLFAKCIRRQETRDTTIFAGDRGGVLECTDARLSFDPAVLYQKKEAQTEEGRDGVEERRPAICPRFLKRGHCGKDSCRSSHDVEMLVDIEHGRQKSSLLQERVEKTAHGTKDSEQGVACTDNSGTSDRLLRMDSREATELAKTPLPASGKAHAAGYDAFCTGFVFACIRAMSNAREIELHRNQIFISGKSKPLLLQSSRFVDLT
uniref:C3H1-type domain-containing protein n=1 Tax=Rhodosorus marinus TaxID=101924 RepID=A0A7S3A2J8_9RHOD|mmetsp:Transcript_41448/g.163191  ORF Transcript_41448/g.163191 Transcript_41448/m.163191 type:complete len:473 (+) Transcript_41448:525-1943(+)|eukprot:CAMPEP_0113957328 /NCGR_PEP_ID=MMETSP0011_2-20120614/2708_1 /TAXON_ID=101924 /ORGANISM="Rhodosorus marinus" /LENGTH=472 /DNA_ID=CAMNT_0000967877 /DNA_START=418 /DNA_END=1836 /DNA_ORIENTATION=- /assembly_acc=CAM_ASM_000156